MPVAACGDVARGAAKGGALCSRLCFEMMSAVKLA